MTRRIIYIIGAGTYGEAMYEMAEELGYEVVGYYDEDDEKQGKNIMGVKVLGKYSELPKEEISGKQYIVAIGNNKVRRKIMEGIHRHGGETPNMIHPTATINKSATLGKGIYIQANVYIWTKVAISDYCIISPNVVIAHHTKVGKACLISTLSGVGASIDIGDEVFVGMGATLVTGLSTIGRAAVIGAGAVVLKDVEEASVYAGVPAKRLKKD